MFLSTNFHGHQYAGHERVPSLEKADNFTEGKKASFHECHILHHK